MGGLVPFMNIFRNAAGIEKDEESQIRKTTHFSGVVYISLSECCFCRELCERASNNLIVISFKHYVSVSVLTLLCSPSMSQDTAACVCVFGDSTPRCLRTGGVNVHAVMCAV